MAKSKTLYVNKSPRVLFLGAPDGSTVQMVPGEPVELDSDIVDSHEELIERGDIEEAKEVKATAKTKKAAKASAPNPNPSTGGDA